MIKILKEINEKIREIAQSEEINTSELIELINIRDKLMSFVTVRVGQIPDFNIRNNFGVPDVTPVTPAAVAFPNLGTHQANTIYDSMLDVANVFLKSRKEEVDKKDDISVHDLIIYYGFISELSLSVDKINNDDKSEIKRGIEHLIVKKLKNIIDKDKEKDKEKDKIKELKTETMEMET